MLAIYDGHRVGSTYFICRRVDIVSLCIGKAESWPHLNSAFWGRTQDFFTRNTFAIGSLPVAVCDCTPALCQCKGTLKLLHCSWVQILFTGIPEGEGSADVPNRCSHWSEGNHPCCYRLLAQQALLSSLYFLALRVSY